MAKNKISEFSSTASDNTDIAGINIAEGCAPSGINNAIRELMAQLKDQQAGTDSDGFVVGGAFTSSGGAVFSSGTTFSGAVVMSNTVSMSGTNNIGTTTTSSTILSGLVTQTTSSKLYLDDSVTTASAPPLSWDGDTNTGIYRPAADTLALVTGGSDRLRIGSTGIVNIGGAVVLGTGDATTSVAGSILRAPSGTGTNITGANFEINAGNGTGTGGSGSIVVKTADVGSSGSTANTLTQRLLITPKGGFSFGSGATDYGTAGQVLKSNGDAPPTFGSSVTSKTVVSASSISVDFTDIPSSAKKITIMFAGLSTNGTSDPIIQLGDSGGVETTGYVAAASTSTTGNSAFSSTAGFPIAGSWSAAVILSGTVVLILQDSATNTWVASTSGGRTDTAGGTAGGGYKALSATLDRIRITTVGGANTFDAGTINIIYE